MKYYIFVHELTANIVHDGSMYVQLIY